MAANISINIDHAWIEALATSAVESVESGLMTQEEAMRAAAEIIDAEFDQHARCACD
jgi:hypothetical protein